VVTGVERGLLRACEPNGGMWGNFVAWHQRRFLKGGDVVEKAMGEGMVQHGYTYGGGKEGWAGRLAGGAWPTRPGCSSHEQAAGGTAMPRNRRECIRIGGMRADRWALATV
jgi:hypothetical protein